MKRGVAGVRDGTAPLSCCRRQEPGGWGAAGGRLFWEHWDQSWTWSSRLQPGWASKARCGGAAGGSAGLGVLPVGMLSWATAANWAPNRLLGSEGVQPVLGPLLESKALHSRAPKCPAFCQPSLPNPRAFPVQGSLRRRRWLGLGGQGQAGVRVLRSPLLWFSLCPPEKQQGQDKHKPRCSSTALSCVRAARLLGGSGGLCHRRRSQRGGKGAAGEQRGGRQVPMPCPAAGGEEVKSFAG